MDRDVGVKARKGWKEYLLRSGVPLEYQVALALAKEEMSVDADFSFLRRDIAGYKEWSVDIAATWYGGPKRNNGAFELRLLLECKYRTQDKFVLCLEDPNELYPQGTLGGTVNSFDFLSPYHLSLDAFVELEGSLKYAYKAVELHDGGAVEEDIRHGIQQLRYATPALLRHVFDFGMSQHPNNAMAIFFTKISLPMRRSES